jgi:hypothetical protein
MEISGSQRNFATPVGSEGYSLGVPEKFGSFLNGLMDDLGVRDWWRGGSCVAL